MKQENNEFQQECANVRFESDDLKKRLAELTSEIELLTLESPNQILLKEKRPIEQSQSVLLKTKHSNEPKSQIEQPSQSVLMSKKRRSSSKSDDEKKKRLLVCLDNITSLVPTIDSTPPKNRNPSPDMFSYDD